MNEVQSIQNLLGHFLKSWYVEIVLFLNLSVVLGILIEVISQKFRDNEKMLFVIKVVNDLQKIFRVKIFTVCTDKSEQLDLINTLVKVILIVLNNFHADHLLSMNIIALDSF